MYKHTRKELRYTQRVYLRLSEKQEISRRHLQWIQVESRTVHLKQPGGRSWGLVRRLRSPLLGRLSSKKKDSFKRRETDFYRAVLKLVRNLSLTSLVVGLLGEHLEVKEPGLQPGHHERSDG